MYLFIANIGTELFLTAISLVAVVVGIAALYKFFKLCNTVERIDKSLRDIAFTQGLEFTSKHSKTDANT